MLPRRGFLAALSGGAFLGLGACGGYELKNLAKTDIDLVTDEFIFETRRLVRGLMVKLFGRNPDQLFRGSVSSVEARVRQLLATPGAQRFSEPGGREEIEAL